MIKYKELESYIDEWRYYSDENNPRLDLEYCKTKIIEKAKEFDLPCKIDEEQIKLGGLFNKEIEECLVISHPNHQKDYVKFCFRLKNQGSVQLLTIDTLGESKQLKKYYISEDNKRFREAIRESDLSLGQKLGAQLSNLTVSSLRTLGKNQSKIDAELQYCEFLTEILTQFKSNND